MFRDNDLDYVLFNLSTSRYLGRQEFANAFVGLVRRYGGNYVPEKWDLQEKVRHRFDVDGVQQVIKQWTAPEESQWLFFERKRPAEIQMFVDIKRFRNAKLNSFSMFVRDQHFSNQGKVDEFLLFATDLCLILRADYASVAQKAQERRQSPILTAAERLPGIYWANFFGRPYIEFFGREKLLATPCHEVRQISDDLILLLTADSPYRPEMLENDDEVNRVKAYLNQNALAGPNFPDEPCSVPQFDFSDVRPPAAGEPEESPIERLRRIRLELESKGYEVIGESQSHLRLRGCDGSVVIVDLASGSISLDITGEAL